MPDRCASGSQRTRNMSPRVGVVCWARSAAPRFPFESAQHSRAVDRRRRFAKKAFDLHDAADVGQSGPLSTRVLKKEVMSAQTLSAQRLSAQAVGGGVARYHGAAARRLG